MYINLICNQVDNSRIQDLTADLPNDTITKSDKSTPYSGET